MEGTDLDDLINLEGTVRGMIFSGSNFGLISAISRYNQSAISERGRVVGFLIYLLRFLIVFFVFFHLPKWNEGLEEGLHHWETGTFSAVP